MTGRRVLAVDLGATSIRVASIDLGSPTPNVEVLHRWHHSPVVAKDGSLRWDWNSLVKHVEIGLEKGMAGDDVISIGIDGWGVDYGLIGEDGTLVELPFAYRDSRTEGWERVADRIGRIVLYEASGVQLMGINTIFQLGAESEERVSKADRLLLLPDLLVNHLTGWVGAEISNMSTTGLMDVRTRDWADRLISHVDVPRRLFPPSAPAGAYAGSWRNVPVSLVGSHDTASAFLGAPFLPGEDAVFVSTGSWVIVGVESSVPNTSDQARRLNFSNEAGALGGVRFLKNVVGFWILEQCRQAWGNPAIESLIEEAAGIDDLVPTFDASDHRFVNPGDMFREVCEAAGLRLDVPRAVVVRSVLQSIVQGVVRVIDEIREVTHRSPQKVLLVGGGSRIPLVGDLLSRQSTLEVVVGSPEATALGNALVQGLASGVFDDLDSGRRWLGATGVAV